MEWVQVILCARQQHIELPLLACVMSGEDPRLLVSSPLMHLETVTKLEMKWGNKMKAIGSEQVEWLKLNCRGGGGGVQGSFSHTISSNVF